MKDLLSQVAFLGFGGMVVISALLVVFLKNLLHAAVALFFCLSGVAALYVMLGADFVGLAQLMIYAGGILVLIIFGVFLTAKIYTVKYDFSGAPLHWVPGIGIGAALFGVMMMVISKTEWPLKTPTSGPTVRGLAELFLTKYLLPFELISLLLLFAMIGAVSLVRKELKE